MTERNRLIIAAIVFAVLWTACMYWWNEPRSLASGIIFVIAGVLVGTFWYIGMRWWMRRVRG